MEEKFKFNLEGTTLTVILGSELAVGNAPAMEQSLRKYMGQDIRKIVFDATDLVYISSAGVRVVIFVRQRLGEKPEVEFLNCAQEIFDTLDIAGVTNFVTFADDERKNAPAFASSVEDIELQKKLADAKQQQLDYFAANNDVVKYQMKMGNEEE